jgi:prevent-host-death family protein
MVIVPSSDLRNRYVELTDRYLNTGEPIYITKNGYGHSVLLGIEDFEKMSKELLALKIERGIREAREGKGTPLDESMERIAKELGL